MSEQDAYKTADSTYAVVSGVVVTPSDTAVFKHTRGLWVGSGGNITLTMMDGANIPLVGVLGGTLLPFQCTAVRSTGTTASNIVALY